VGNGGKGRTLGISFGANNWKLVDTMASSWYIVRRTVKKGHAMKRCQCCKKVKILEDFPLAHKRKDGTRRGDGYRSVCKACDNVKAKKLRSTWSHERRLKAKIRQREQIRRWDAEHPYATKAAKANLHAKRVGAVGRVSAKDVESAWLRYDGKCWVCGFKATELDHYRPINGKSGGTNTADNILPICRECNQKRSHLWHGEVIAKKEAEMLRDLKILLNEAT